MKEPWGKELAEREGAVAVEEIKQEFTRRKKLRGRTKVMAYVDDQQMLVDVPEADQERVVKAIEPASVSMGCTVREERCALCGPNRNNDSYDCKHVRRIKDSMVKGDYEFLYISHDSK